MEKRACVCAHGLERSGLCAEMILMKIKIKIKIMMIVIRIMIIITVTTNMHKIVIHTYIHTW